MFNLIYSIVFSLVIVVSFNLVISKFSKNKKVRIVSIAISVLLASYLQTIQSIKLSVAKVFGREIANELIINHKIKEFSHTDLVTKYLKENKDTDLYKEFKDIFKIGLKRLEYEDLKTWREIKIKTLSLSDEVCEDISSGNSTSNDIFNYIKRLSPSDVEAWMDVQLKAAKYEMIRYEYFPANEREFNQALDKIIENLSAEDKSRFNDTYRLKIKSSNKDLCFVSKILYGNTEVLSPELELKYLRYLASKFHDQK